MGLRGRWSRRRPGLYERNPGRRVVLVRQLPPFGQHGIPPSHGSMLSTGGFATHTTSGVTDLAAIARGAGIPHVAAVSSFYEFMEAAAAAFDRNELSVIVAKVEATGPDHFGMDLKLPENAFRFERFVRERQRQAVAA